MKLYDTEKILIKIQEKWEKGDFEKAIKILESEYANVRLLVAVRESKRGNKYVAYILRGLQSGRDMIILPQDLEDIAYFFKSIDNVMLDKLLNMNKIILDEYSPKRKIIEEEEPEDENNEDEDKEKKKKGKKR